MTLDDGLIVKMLTTMLRIRYFEEKVADSIEKNEIKTPCHLCIGQEAIATGVCLNLSDTDVIYGNHRSHGHYIAKGGNIKELMAEVFCKKTGCSEGKGGSMHIVSTEKGVLGTPPIVAGTIPIATGSALGFKILEKRNVAISFFGDGATNEGVFYESLNFASLNKLPIVFVCENNLYATHMGISKCSSNTRIFEKAKAFDMESIVVDGNDVIEVYERINEILNTCRDNNQPYLIEAKTYRWRGHVGPNYDIDKNLRTKEELEKWMDKCPIKKIEKHVIDKKILDEKELNKTKKEIFSEINSAYRFAIDSPYPNKDDLNKGVFCI